MARMPKLCFHKGRRLGYATDPVTGREHYFASDWGPGGRDKPSVDVVAEYERWVARVLLRRQEVPGNLDPAGLTIAELMNSFHQWSLTYYRRPDGTGNRKKVTSEPANIFHALEHAVRLYPAVPVDEFGPLALKEVRSAMVQLGYSRKYINDAVHRIRRAFRWGVENELVRPEVLAKLKAVPSLAKGRTIAAEQQKVRPVELAIVERTAAAMTPLWASLVRVHLYGGMRAEEAVTMRLREIDRHSTPWCYRPAFHKTTHHDIDREIWLGPQARAALEPLLKNLARDAWIFPGQGRGPHAKFSGHATVSGYASRIERACQRAQVPRWTPRQLRHTWLSHLRRVHERGIDAAQVVAGHAELNTTEIYAERNRELGQDAAERFG